MNEKIEELQPFDPEQYNSIDLDRLIMYTAVELDRLNIELTFENIVVGAFLLFPKKFSLARYPEYPDALRVDKALRRRYKGHWIGGKTSHGFWITDMTLRVAAQAEALLSKKSLRHPKTPSRMPRRESILREVEKSPGYVKYSQGDKEAITEAELCYLLQGTLDSSKETLRDNFQSLKILTKELERKELLEFLSYLSQRFKDFLEIKQTRRQ